MIVRPNERAQNGSAGCCYVCARRRRLIVCLGRDCLHDLRPHGFGQEATRTIGESVVLTLRSGGEVTLDKSLIEKIVPDEVAAPGAGAAGAPNRPRPPAEPAVRARPGLRETRLRRADCRGRRGPRGRIRILVQALIQVESNYQPRARSNKGAMGLMQLMPATAREYKVRNAYDPAANIDAGVKKLKGLIDTFEGTRPWRSPPTTPAKGRSRSSTASRRTARPRTTSRRSSRSPASSKSRSNFRPDGRKSTQPDAP